MIPLPSLSSSLGPLRVALDAASPDARINWMRGLGRGELKALFALAAPGGAVPLDMLVGGEGEVIIHEGQNSLPAFNTFQKRFVRREGVVQGYNHNSDFVAFFSGPGHFTVRPDGDEALVDYIVLPATVPSEFPALIDNNGGTRGLIFGGLIDRLRRVSLHCTIGEASKGGKPFPAWFMLVRQGDPADPTYKATIA
jgi:hypothetical protein